MIALHTDQPLPDGLDVEVDPERELLVATDDGRPAGVVVWRIEADLATVSRLASVPGADHDVALLDAVRARARAVGVATLVVEVGDDQAALLTSLQGATVLSRFMVKPVPDQPPTLPPGFAARDKTPDEYAAWKRTAIEEYAQENLARSGGNRELALQRSHESYDRFLPDGLATADTHLLTLTLDGRPAGDLWVRHHWPRYREAAAADQAFIFDVQVDADLRGRGLGRAAMLAAERLAIEAGDRQLGLNVFGDNDVATGLYVSLGYTARSTVFDVPLG